MSYWQNASTQQRLAQIDGAISVGMTMRQTAMNLGTYVANIQQFAHANGRSFRGYSKSASAIRGESARSVSHLGRMTIQRRAGKAEIDLVGSFEIFPSKAKEDHILDRRGDE